MINKLLSYLVGLTLGLLLVAPVIPYTIPLVINSYVWLYAVIAFTLLGFLLLHYNIHISLKILIVYLFINNFFSQAPALGFTAYILVVSAMWLFVICQHLNFEIIVRFLKSAFWVQVFLAFFQLVGRDKLLGFDHSNSVFFGTIMQYMRFSSMLSILSPFLIVSNPHYIVPLIIMCVFSNSLSFALSLFLAILVWVILTNAISNKTKRTIIISIFGLAMGYAIYDWGSVRGAVLPENGGRLVTWFAVLQTWVLDTSRMQHPSPILIGPWKWHWFFFGHGMDTFLPLFPIYKHDINPFPQAHNDWLQLLWEIGIIGFSLIIYYSIYLIINLYKRGYFMLLSGLVCIATNMFFAFPMRMTQTMFLIVVYLAYCQKKINIRRS